MDNKDFPPHLKMVAEDYSIEPDILLSIVTNHMGMILTGLAKSGHPGSPLFREAVIRAKEAAYWLSEFKELHKKIQEPSIVTPDGIKLN